VHMIGNFEVCVC